MSLQQHIATRWIYNPRHRHRLLGLSLLALHVAVLPGADAALRTTSVFIHFALFLVWQPFWHGGTEIRARTALILLVSITGLLIWPGWLILTMWLLVLIGLLGGEQVGSPHARKIQWLAVGGLFLILLLGVVPQLFQAQIGAPLMLEVARYAAGGLAVMLIFMPGESETHFDEHVDYLRSLSITFMALLLSMGSALWMYAAQIDYTLALFQTLLFVAGFIFAANWVWSNRSGHSIIQTLWNRYLLNLGTPFEQFLINLSDYAEQHNAPDAFLRHALDELLKLSWVSGVHWHDDHHDTLLGETTPHAVEVKQDGLEMTLYSNRDVGPAFVLHINLLAQLIEHFYRALERERQLETAMRMEAIHQTGSRLTHDIKNLLQSMEYLAAVVQSAGPEQAESSLALLQKQFPELRNRLQLTLEKLKSPEQEVEEVRGISASGWWTQLKQRYADGRIEFDEELDGDATIPKELFDSVAENLLENASFKQVIDRGIIISARLEIDDGKAMLEVHDSGEQVPPEVARGLFREAVSSKQGLGVGLYQSHRLARQHGYDLGLIANRDGDVGFLLEPAA